MTKNCYLGLLSGTSIDGIDAAAVSFDNSGINFIAQQTFAIPKQFKTACLKITETGVCHIDDIGQLDNWAGELFAAAALQLLQANNLHAPDIIAIGSHGQTLRHQPSLPRPFSMQIGNPNIISAKTTIPTVADFRRMDLAVGGQGAPLAPAFHQAAFYNPLEHRIIVNIGGISNATILSNDAKQPLIGFDTGPGNCLLDYWANLNFAIPFDKNGAHAQQGTTNSLLLQALLADPFFQKSPPKTTGRDYFNSKWLSNKLSACKDQLSADDVQATLLELTTTTIAQAIQPFIQENTKIYLCGGGANNQLLITSMSSLLNTHVQTTHNLGIDPNWVEAGLFAWLAKQAWEGTPTSLSTVTGANQAVTLGGIYHGEDTYVC